MHFGLPEKGSDLSLLLRRSITLSILYYNYHENTLRLETRKKSAVLDHWGKGAPTKVRVTLT